jgi:tape measure domain-containing protein
VPFDYEMKADGSQAVAESRKVEESLVRIEKTAKSTGEAIEHGFAGSGLKDAAGRFIATSVAADQLRSRAPLLTAAYDAYQAKVRAAAQRTEELSRAQARSAAIVDRNAAANQPLVRSFEGIATALQKETAMLEAIRGPMRQHQEDVALLTNMYRRGAVTSQEFLAGLSKIDSRKPGAGGGGGHGGEGSILSKAGAGQFVKEQGGGLGSMVGGIMEGGVGTLATAAGVGMIVEGAKKAVEAIVELGDAYTELTNKAIKMATGSQSVEGVLDDNLNASNALHASLRETLELTDAVKDGTEELNLTTAQQAQLSRGLGAAVRLSGKDISEAGGLLNKLGYSLSNGTVTFGEFKSMIKEFPDLMGIMQSSTGKSRDELFRMAKAGELSGEMIVNAATSAGDAMVDKLGDRMETTGEKMQHLKDRFAVAWGGIAQAASSALGKIIDGLADVIDPFKDMREGIEQATHAAKLEAEIDEKMVANAEKLIQIKTNLNSLPAASRPAGANFDLELVQNYSRLRAVMFEVTVAGVNLGSKMKDPMEMLSSKATQLANRVQDLIDQHAGEKMAEDAKKAYKAQQEINDVLDAQFKKVADAVDKVAEYEGALTRLAKLRGMVAAKNQNPMGPQGLLEDQTPSLFGNAAARWVVTRS